jgi:hypothetical protein
MAVRSFDDAHPPSQRVQGITTARAIEGALPFSKDDCTGDIRVIACPRSTNMAADLFGESDG